MEIKKLSGIELNKGLKLVWEVFLECEAFGYNRNGVEEFRKFLDNKEIFKIFDTFGAYYKNELIGVVSLQDQQHICLFFIKKEFQKMGIGKELLDYILKKSLENEITINSALSAVNIFKKLGFSITDVEQKVNGIKFTPMSFNKQKKLVEKLKCRDKEIELGKRTLIMGILNVTPDSFSDGGKHNSVEAAVEHAKKMLLEGADIIDVGGQSTRPGYTEISVEEEISRVVPVIKEVVKLGATVSIDTYKYQVAEAALKAGAHIVNDIWGLQYDKGEMAKVVKKYDVPVIAMHNQNGNRYKQDIILTMKEFFNKTFEICERYQIPKNTVILDPGIGFGKNYEENLEVLNRLHELRNLGRILLGCSRKRFIGTILNDIPPHERVIGTVATTVCGIEKGVDIVRVHDILENKEASMIADKILRR